MRLKFGQIGNQSKGRCCKFGNHTNLVYSDARARTHLVQRGFNIQSTLFDYAELTIRTTDAVMLCGEVMLRSPFCPCPRGYIVCFFFARLGC